MAIKCGDYLLINYRDTTVIFEQKILTKTTAAVALHILANRFSSDYLLVQVLDIASPAPSSPDAFSPAQDGDAHPVPIEGPTNKAE